MGHFRMTIVSGHCALVIDGKEYRTYSYAFELPGTSAVRRLGFLSGPSEFLEAAQRGNQAQIELDSGETLDIKVLEINATGLALITFINRNRT
jgi:hypothetical protein